MGWYVTTARPFFTTLETEAEINDLDLRSLQVCGTFMLYIEDHYKMIISLSGSLLVRD